MSTHSAHAQFISEIMYDAPGTDTKREWIEIYIDAESDIDSIRIIENDVRHTLTGDIVTIPAESYVVIASDTDTFLSDHPNFNGIVLDSVFSLLNQGEFLGLEIYESIIDSVEYIPSENSHDQEYSLQRIEEKWIHALATPGSINENNQEEGSPDKNISSSSGTISNSAQKSSSNSQFKTGKKIHTRKLQDISIGRERIGYPQVPLSFEVITKDGLYQNDKVAWSFGDGYSKKGIKVKHAYMYPGTYVVTAHILGKTEAGISRTIVHVLEPELVISEVSDTYIVIHNPLAYEVNIGGMYIDFKEDDFKIPENTIILSDTKITIPFAAMILRSGIDLSQPTLRAPSKK